MLPTSVPSPTHYQLGSSEFLAIEGRNHNWDFDALVSMNDFVELTPEIPHKSGWAFAKEVAMSSITAGLMSE